MWGSGRKGKRWREGESVKRGVVGEVRGGEREEGCGGECGGPER